MPRDTASTIFSAHDKPREKREALLADRLAKLIQVALVRASEVEAGERTPRIRPSTTLDQVDSIVREADLDVVRVLAEATLEALRTSEGHPPRDRRDNLRFLVANRRRPEQLRFTSPEASTRWSLSPETVAQAIVHANRTIELLHDVALSNGVPLFHLLGMRNLSSFVGEVVARELQRLERERFLPNPHQDGHPDLLALTPEGVAYIRERERKSQLSEKRFWSPYPFGGVEIKATCGNTPPAHKVAKPEIGESRIPILVSAEWKAHHQNTNNLLGVYWDFVDGLPTVLAAFYRNDLTPDDWGEVIVPEEGSHTTSVSIMKQGRRGDESGVKKMGKGWVVLPSDSEMLEVLSRVFGLSREDLDSAISQPTRRARPS